MTTPSRKPKTDLKNVVKSSQKSLKPKTGSKREQGKDETPVPKWRLRLYVAGQSTKSMTALENLRALCEKHMPGEYKIEIIDLIQQPQLARGDQIVAIPTLVRELPAPMKKIIGDLSNVDKTLVGLDLRPVS